jgi:hypothetical protein
MEQCREHGLYGSVAPIDRNDPQAFSGRINQGRQDIIWRPDLVMDHVGLIRHDSSDGSYALPISPAKRIAEKANMQCLTGHKLPRK